MAYAQRILFLAPAAAVTPIFPILRDAGFEVGLAENLKGASAFINKAGPSVIFSRPQLPGYKVEDLLSVGADDPLFPHYKRYFFTVKLDNGRCISGLPVLVTIMLASYQYTILNSVIPISRRLFQPW